MAASYPPELIESLRAAMQAALQDPANADQLPEGATTASEAKVTNPTFGETTIAL